MHVFEQENVRTLHVSVHNFSGVKSSKAPHNLDEDVPDLLLLNVSFSFLVATYLLENVSIVGVLHH